MLYNFAGRTITTVNQNISPNDQGQYLGVMDYEESKPLLGNLKINFKLLDYWSTNRSMVYENHEDFDFIGLSILNRNNLFAPKEKVCVFVRKNLILVVADKPDRLEKVFDQITENKNIAIGFDRVLSSFFERLIGDDVNILEDIEQEIADLENELITSGIKNCVREIVSLRKRLMLFKQYYEQLLDVLDDLLENENEILSDTSLKYFRIFDGKVDRLYHNVLNLRDYVTQVRESYQAEVDIGLNNIMKIFTVITAIFLPLTLLVGWYGMNLQMPEYSWVFGYPMVIIVAIIIVIFFIFFFRKNKWF